MVWDTCNTTLHSPTGGGGEKTYNPKTLHSTLPDKDLLHIQDGGTDDQQYHTDRKIKVFHIQRKSHASSFIFELKAWDWARMSVSNCKLE